MSGNFLVHAFYFSFVLLMGTIKIAYNSPLYSYPVQTDPAKYSMDKQVIVAQVDKPLDEVLEAVMQLDGNILVLIPQRDVKKRDPSGPDLGTGRSYTGQRTAKVMWGQLASNSPTGPGRRKRNSTDGEGAAPWQESSNDEYFPSVVVKREGEMFPQ